MKVYFAPYKRLKVKLTNDGLAFIKDRHFEKQSEVRKGFRDGFMLQLDEDGYYELSLAELATIIYEYKEMYKDNSEKLLHGPFQGDILIETE